MGAGGLNGQLRDHSEHVESIFRYNFNVDGRDVPYFQRTSTHRQHQGAEEAPSSQPQTFEGETMICKRCSISLHFYNKKKHCRGCKDVFCSLCFVLRAKNGENAGWCFSCRALGSPVTYKEQLIELKVKELQNYLRARNVSTVYCKEKKDLVDLVLFDAQERAGMPGSAMPRESASQRTTQHQHQEAPSSIHESRDTTNPSTSIHSTENVPPQKTSKPYRRTLNDLQTIGEVSNLSVRELKHILTANFVDFKGCCEKEELLQRVCTLWKSKQEEGKTDNGEGNGCDDEQCKICMDASIDCVLLECGHMATCTNCGRQLADCPICRQYISRIVHVFKA